MAESEGIQAMVNQAAVQAAMMVMITLRDADLGPRPPANTAIPREPQRHGRLALEKPSFNWNAQDKYVELLNFEI